MRPFFFLLLHSFNSPETAQLLYLLERNTHSTNMGRNLVCPQFEGNVLAHMLPKASRIKKCAAAPNNRPNTNTEF